MPMIRTHQLIKNGCTLTINYENERVYPSATGKVPKKLQKAIDRLRGQMMPPEHAFAMLKYEF
jgi:hypothetical protein